MKRLIATLAIGTALAGCGGASQQQLAQAQCTKWKADAQVWAQNYASSLPGPLPQGEIRQLADSAMPIMRSTHGYYCR